MRPQWPERRPWRPRTRTTGRAALSRSTGSSSGALPPTCCRSAQRRVRPAPAPSSQPVATCCCCGTSSCPTQRSQLTPHFAQPAEILEVTGQKTKEGAYMMTIGVFVACFLVSSFVRNRMMGTQMSFFPGPDLPPLTPGEHAGAQTSRPPSCSGPPESCAPPCSHFPALRCLLQPLLSRKHSKTSVPRRRQKQSPLPLRASPRGRRSPSQRRLIEGFVSLQTPSPHHLQRSAHSSVLLGLAPFHAPPPLPLARAAFLSVAFRSIFSIDNFP